MYECNHTILKGSFTDTDFGRLELDNKGVEGFYTGIKITENQCLDQEKRTRRETIHKVCCGNKAAAAEADGVEGARVVVVGSLQLKRGWRLVW